MGCRAVPSRLAGEAALPNLAGAEEGSLLCLSEAVGYEGYSSGRLFPQYCLEQPAGARLRAEQNPAEVPSRIDPKAQQVIDRVIRALGGPAFLKMKRLTTRGRIFSITDESTSGFAPFESAVEYPDKRRFSYGKRPPVILINNGDQAWELDRYGQTAQTAGAGPALEDFQSLFAGESPPSPHP